MSPKKAEKCVMDLIDLFHKYTSPDDTVNKEGLQEMLKEYFPHFLRACVSCGGRVSHIAWALAWRRTLSCDFAQVTPVL